MLELNANAERAHPECAASDLKEVAMDPITVWLWCDGTAEAMAEFYTGLVPHSRIVEVVRAPAASPGARARGVLMVEFMLGGRRFIAVNGGSQVPFIEAVSLQVLCNDQAEVDRYWTALSSHPQNEQCGWLKDKFGLSWQIVPHRLGELLADADREKAGRVMERMLTMTKIDIAALERAAACG